MYFDKVYVPIYDATTGMLPCYQRLQRECVDNLKEVKDCDSVLCVGVGTGNEVNLILDKNNKASVTGIDYSVPSIEKAKDRLDKRGNVSLLVGDARSLPFGDKVFDKVLCIAVMSFVRDRHRATMEIARVLKTGGTAVVTYPSLVVGTGNVFVRQLRSSHNGSVSRLLRFLLYTALYYPMLLFPQEKTESTDKIKQWFCESGMSIIGVSRDPVYGNHIFTLLKREEQC
jgi:ubiquinone/menaquinone biosynthesis C-methylase UbiE